MLCSGPLKMGLIDYQWFQSTSGMTSGCWRKSKNRLPWRVHSWHLWAIGPTKPAWSLLQNRTASLSQWVVLLEAQFSAFCQRICLDSIHSPASGKNTMNFHGNLPLVHCQTMLLRWTGFYFMLQGWPSQGSSHCDWLRMGMWHNYYEGDSVLGSSWKKRNFL